MNHLALFMTTPVMPVLSQIEENNVHPILNLGDLKIVSFDGEIIKKRLSIARDLDRFLSHPSIPAYTPDQKQIIRQGLFNTILKMNSQEFYKKCLPLGTEEAPWSRDKKNLESPLKGEFWVERRKKNFEVTFRGEQIGSGNYKTYHQAPTCIVDLNYRIVKIKDKVISIPHPKVLPSPNCRNAIILSLINEGRTIQKQLLGMIENKEDKIKIMTKLPRERFPLAFPNSLVPWSKENWLNGSLCSAVESGKFPFKMGRAETRDFSIKDLLDICLGVAGGLDFFHKAGYIHRDVTPGNILIQTEETGPMKGIAADYDVMGDMGSYVPETKLFPQWDKCAREGLEIIDVQNQKKRVSLNTPFTDCFGLGTVIFTSLFGTDIMALVTDPAFFEGEEWTNKISRVLKILIEQSQIEDRYKPTLLEKLGKYSCSFPIILEELQNIPDSNELFAQIKVCKITIEMMQDILAADHSFYHFVKMNPNVQKILVNPNMNEILKHIPEIEKHYYTMSQIKDKLIEMRRLFDK